MEHLDKDEQRIMELLPRGIDRPRPLKEILKKRTQIIRGVEF